jgi:pyrroline-5-carboxylate reductase
MSSVAEELDRLDRIHDERPEEAAAGLLALDADALDEGQRRTYAFLLNHVLGEKLGRWPQALSRLAPLAAAADAPLALLRQHAVAAHHAGDAAQAEATIARLAARAGTAPPVARELVQVAALSFARDIAAAAPALARAAGRAAGFAASPLDEAFAASFNNATQALYDATREAALTPEQRVALARGADAALLHWLRAGGWMQHERAHYLCAKVALRLGEPVAAASHAERGLAIVAAHGDDPVERAFLLQLLAAAVERAGQRERAAALRAETQALALDAGTREALAQDAAEFPALPAPRLAFIGGGNMATALIGGLLRSGHAAAQITVVEIDPARSAQLERDFGIAALAAPGPALRDADAIVLAVKPQQMREACLAVRPWLGKPLVVSVAAGTRSADIARWLGADAIVRTMPNTPALIGRGITGMTATASVSAAQRLLAESILRTAGEVMWFDDESMLDAVTAVSGSGPAYVFYVIEALVRAGAELHLTEAQARALAVQTFVGAAHLAAESSEPVETLRARVTSKGGTTAAALAWLESNAVAARFVEAVHAAHRRAGELGDEYGRD